MGKTQKLTITDISETTTNVSFDKAAVLDILAEY